MKYLWRITNDYPEQYIGEYQREISPDRFDLRKGITLSAQWGIPIFNFNASKSDLLEYDDLANSALVPLVSSRLANDLRVACNDLIQLISADIKTLDGRLKGYYVVNVTHIGECIDKAASEYSIIRGTDQIMGFSRIKILENPDPRMIVREKIYPSFIVVSDEFKRMCDDLDFKGIGLAPAEGV